MRCFKLLVLVVLAVSMCLAAPWDGKRGPFEVLTITSPGSLPGIPRGSGATYTVIRVECPDSTISGVRVKFTYHDEGGDHQVSMLSDFSDGHGGIVTAVPWQKITAIQFIELRETASY